MKSKGCRRRCCTGEEDTGFTPSFLLVLLVGLTCLAHRVAAAPGGLSPALSAEEQVPRLGRNVLMGGWYPWDPYQYGEDRHGVQILTGFDIEIERALERVMGVELILTDRAWDQHLAAIAAGTADLTAGATYSPERNRYAYFSKPYRRETDVLVVRKGASTKYPFRSIEQMLDLFRKQRFRLGVIAGYVYADERINEFIAD